MSGAVSGPRKALLKLPVTPSRAAFGNDFLQDKYGVSSAQSGRLVGALSLSSIVLSPLAGLAMDKFGGHEAASCAAMAVSAVCFALYGFADLPAWPVTALAGVCYGILPAALYPMLADVVPEESFAHVYAILTAGINLVLATSTVISGAISDTDIEISRRRRELRSWGGGAFADPLPPVQPLPRPDYSGVFAMFVICESRPRAGGLRPPPSPFPPVCPRDRLRDRHRDDGVAAVRQGPGGICSASPPRARAGPSAPRGSDARRPRPGPQCGRDGAPAVCARGRLPGARG